MKSALSQKPFVAITHETTESNKTGSWRFLKPRYQDKTSPCSAGCPAGEDIGMIEMLARQGLFKEAWKTILRENPLPGVCGRVCFHPCETACNRKNFDSPIVIHTLERRNRHLDSIDVAIMCSPLSHGINELFVFFINKRTCSYRTSSFSLCPRTIT